MKLTKSIWAVALGLALAFTGQAQADEVALFYNGSYVDVSSTNPWGHLSQEAVNVKNIAENFGHTVNTFTGITAADWTAAGASNDIIIIPEIEAPDNTFPADPTGINANDLIDDLDPAARQAIRDYVFNGGVLLIMGGAGHNYYSAVETMNGLFGTTATTTDLGVGSFFTSTLYETAVQGTAFETLPTTLFPVYAVIPFTSDPEGSIPIYSGAGVTHVTWTTYGQGGYGYMSWDAFIADLDQNPGTIDFQDTTQHQLILDAFIRQAGGRGQNGFRDPSTAPEPGTIALVGGIAAAAAWRRRRKAKKAQQAA